MTIKGLNSTTAFELSLKKEMDLSEIKGAI